MNGGAEFKYRKSVEHKYGPRTGQYIRRSNVRKEFDGTDNLTDFFESTTEKHSALSVMQESLFSDISVDRSGDEDKKSASSRSKVTNNSKRSERLDRMLQMSSPKSDANLIQDVLDKELRDEVSSFSNSKSVSQASGEKKNARSGRPSRKKSEGEPSKGRLDSFGESKTVIGGSKMKRLSTIQKKKNRDSDVSEYQDDAALLDLLNKNPVAQHLATTLATKTSRLSGASIAQSSFKETDGSERLKSYFSGLDVSEDGWDDKRKKIDDIRKQTEKEVNDYLNRKKEERKPEKAQANQGKSISISDMGISDISRGPNNDKLLDSLEHKKNEANRKIDQVWAELNNEEEVSPEKPKEKDAKEKGRKRSSKPKELSAIKEVAEVRERGEMSQQEPKEPLSPMVIEPKLHTQQPLNEDRDDPAEEPWYEVVNKSAEFKMSNGSNEKPKEHDEKTIMKKRTRRDRRSRSTEPRENYARSQGQAKRGTSTLIKGAKAKKKEVNAIVNHAGTVASLLIIPDGEKPAYIHIEAPNLKEETKERRYPLRTRVTPALFWTGERYCYTNRGDGLVIEGMMKQDGVRERLKLAPKRMKRNYEETKFNQKTTVKNNMYKKNTKLIKNKTQEDEQEKVGEDKFTFMIESDDRTSSKVRMTFAPNGGKGRERNAIGEMRCRLVEGESGKVCIIVGEKEHRLRLNEEATIPKDAIYSVLNNSTKIKAELSCLIKKATLAYIR